MITTGTKFYLGAATAALLAAFVYGWGTGGGLLGVLTFGLRGGVGELAGYTVLVSLSACALVLAIATSALRDADAEALAAVARLDTVPAALPPSGPSYWPVVGAFAFVVTIVGLVASPVLFVGGLMLGGAALLEWMVQAWADRATGDPGVNREIRNRLMYPIEIPVAGAAAIVVVIVCVSRILLALSKNAASAIAIAVAVVVLALAFVISYRPRIGRDAIAGLLVVAAIAVVAGGIVAAAAGPRDFEHHGEEEHEDDGSTEEGLVSLDVVVAGGSW